MERTGLAADRPAGGRLDHRTGVHPRDRVADAGRGEAPRGGRVRAVVITGVGCVTPAGTGADGLWAGLKARRSPIRTLTRFDPERFRTRIAAEVPEFHPQDHMTRKAAKRFDRFSQFGVPASRLAVTDAALVPEREDRDRIGVSMGSALGGIAHAEHEF